MGYFSIAPYLPKQTKPFPNHAKVANNLIIYTDIPPKCDY